MAPVGFVPVITFTSFVTEALFEKILSASVVSVQLFLLAHGNKDQQSGKKDIYSSTNARGYIVC